MKTKRWQDWINLLLGAWLFASPWALKYASTLPKAAWNAYILGAAIVIFAAVAVSVPKAWEEAINIILGAWVAISPWVLRFAAEKNVAMNAALVGCAVLLLAIWAMVRDQDFQRWRHGGHTAT
ncbi:SPW repeat protein [Noviherbaspirillum sp.]|uniref:SPW repeat protein n=1 Tax=Noviherbaspirillum sp. TaxID=1926288 RepID=UPI002B49250A|nr:SPW repeat protein [Noviherbaspirillum sp.]HJV80044.1 SPW repeat protein [Noviherbaspirillum sp.]